jgi:hypothetical protein
MFGWEGLKIRVWVRGLDFFGPDYGQVVEPVGQGNETLSCVKYGKFIDCLAISPEEGICSMDLLIIIASNSVKIGIVYSEQRNRIVSNNCHTNFSRVVFVELELFFLFFLPSLFL